MNIVRSLFAGALVSLLAAPAAAQGIEECGNVYVESDANCGYLYDEECTESCTVGNVYDACAAITYPTCDQECTPVLEQSCVETCRTTCDPDCETLPAGAATENCFGLCFEECQGDCDAVCADVDDEEACEASCGYTCSVNCEGRCDEVGNDDTCDTTCTSACSGACEADSEQECQIDCQLREREACEAAVIARCETDCGGTDGALFCDGKYVDHQDNLEQCVDYLEGFVDGGVDVDPDANIDCEEDDGTECAGDAELDTAFGCNGAEVKNTETPLFAGALLMLSATGWLIRRRRRR